MFDRLREEYKILNPVRRIVHYIIAPVYSTTVIILAVVSIILRLIDEYRFVVPCTVMTSLIILSSVAIFICLSIVRKKELALELKRYDFDLKSAEPKEQYVFEKDELIETFAVEKSPFDDLNGNSAVFSGMAGLNELLNGYGIDRANAQMNNQYYDYNVGIGVNDYSEHAVFTNFYAKSCGENEVGIFSAYDVTVDRYGIILNGYRLDFDKSRAEITSYNFLFHVEIYLGLFFEDSDVSIELKLDKDVLAMISKFNINVENRDVLDFILHHKQDAFKEILKRGRITDRTLKKFKSK